jgi:hypothetical protein
MPTLDWIGKSAVVDHHRKVAYRLLRCDRELSTGDADVAQTDSLGGADVVRRAGPSVVVESAAR